VLRPVITQHFGMKLLSTSDPALIPSIKTPTPLRSGFPSSSQTIIIEQASSNSFRQYAPSRNQQIIFRRSFQYRNGRTPRTTTKYSKEKKSSLHSLKAIRSTMQLGKCPIKALPQVPQLSPYDMPRIPQLPIDPFFPPRPHPKKPYRLGEDISEIGTVQDSWDRIPRS